MLKSSHIMNVAIIIKFNEYMFTCFDRYDEQYYLFEHRQFIL